MEKAYNYVYITTNLKNSKQYVGDHSTNNLEDEYLGSGIWLKNSIKKHGKDNFKREILEYFDTKLEASNHQEYYINKYNTLIPNGYNISPKGGTHLSGNHSLITRKKLSKLKKGIPLSEDHKEKLKGKNKGKIHSKETIEKRSKSLKGRIVSKETREKIKLKNTGKIVSEETKKKISKKNKNRVQSKETREKRSKALTNKKHKLSYSICPHCKFEGVSYNITRYHNDNCKLKGNSIEEIKKLVSEKTYTILEISKMFNISKSTVYKIKNL